MRDQSHLLAARRVVGASVTVVHARHHDGALIGALYAETHARLPQPATQKRVWLVRVRNSFCSQSLRNTDVDPILVIEHDSGLRKEK